ncbi:hypothetical protein PENSTE_c012G09731 [Penicillium steckii]|uniref:DDE-1 domain-containing protein n=1 Tax=Penicillium steckii TaxID=303698 RepID=A0A1V6T5S7_9EURO|nr:hypothetical protein PENSTE_c012G09731 [Penicillium steckii]
MEPYFVAPGSVHMVRWYNSGNLSEETRIAVSEPGYSNDQLAIDWLEFFHQNTKNRLPNKRKQPRLLIMDGHRSHLTLEFLELCDFYNIIPYVCPAHTTHLVQPLDGSPFRALKKKAYRTQNNKVTQWGGDARDAGVFFAEISAIREQALTPKTIRKAFADRGIWPYKPELIIDKLANEQSPTPELQIWTGSPPPQQASSIPSSPPNNSYAARRTSDKMANLLQNKAIPDELRRQFGRVGRLHVRLAQDIDLLNDTLECQLPKQPTTARKSQRQIGKFGVLTTKDAVRLANERNKMCEKRNNKTANNKQHAGIQQQNATPRPTTPPHQNDPVVIVDRYPSYKYHTYW